MNPSQTLVIDQGTHATRALVVDQDGQVKATARCEIALHQRAPGVVEQDGDEIIASLHQTVEDVLADPVVRRQEVACAGLASQRSSVIAWDLVSGEPLTPMMSWQDRRAAQWLEQFNDKAKIIKQQTGLPLSPHYGASKLRWAIDRIPAVKLAQREGRLAYGPVCGFLLFHLLKNNPLIVDHVTASRTQLWNIQTRNWDPWLLDLFGVPGEPLPACRPILHQYGELQAAQIPLTAVNGDQNSAIYSLGKPHPRTALVNIGTGAFILVLTGSDPLPHPALLTSLASSENGGAEYLIEGTVNGAGAAITWAAKEWNIPDIFHKLPSWLARDEEPPLFLNTIGGLGSPWWRPEVPSIMVGDAQTPLRVVAVIESILFLLQINLETMTDAGLTVDRIQVTGGLARLNQLCQRLANLTQRPVYRPAEKEATARGVAWLAAGKPCRWPKPGRGQFFRPQVDQKLVHRYHQFREHLALQLSERNDRQP